MLAATLSVLVFFAILAIILKDNLLSILSLAVVSALLAVSFFQLRAPVAGVFELSVGSGLVTVLAVLTISFIQSKKEKKEKKEKTGARWVVFILAIAALSFLFLLLINRNFVLLPLKTVWNEAGNTLWKERSFDLFPQMLVVIAGVLGIITLLRKEKGEKK